MTRRLLVLLAALAALSSCTGSAARSSPPAAPPSSPSGGGFAQRVPVLDGYGVAGGVPAGRAKVLKVTVAVGGGCDERGTAAVTAAETSGRVMLTATVFRPHRPKPRRPDIVCPANLIAQTVSVRLKDPLGTRTVRDAATGKDLKRQP